MLPEILKALNQPTTPQWLITTFSTLLGASVGFVSGLFGQTLMMFVTELVECRRMRKAVYRDLAHMFCTVHMYLNSNPQEYAPNADPTSWIQDQLRKYLFFQMEKHCLDKPEIYIQLPERVAALELYRRFHEILEPNYGFHVNTRSLLNIFGRYVHDQVLKPKHFVRYLGRQEGRRVVSIAEGYYKQNEERIKRLIDEGEKCEDNPPLNDDTS
jgi:hypothetical protein